VQRDERIFEEAGYGRSPVICTDVMGDLWAAWVLWDERGERIRVCRKEHGGSWGSPFDAASPRSRIFALRLCPYGTGVAMAWIDGDHPERDGLKLRELRADHTGEATLLVPLRRLPAHPTLDGGSGKLAVAWTVREPAGRRLEACVGDTPESLAEPCLVSTRGGFHAYPSLSLFGGGALVAWQEMSRKGCRLLARQLLPDGAVGETVVLAAHSQGTFARPDTVAAEGGVYVAWQSDTAPGGVPGLTRWIELVHLDAVLSVRRPAAPMVDLDRDAAGEDQGFESPSLVALADGRLAIVGRGSQSLRLQMLGRDGFGPRNQIDEPGWACRGQKFDAVALLNSLFVIGRERRGIVLREVVVGDEGGPGKPELAEAASVPVLSAGNGRPSPLIVAGHRVLFGDIHQHTALSDGTGTVDESLHRARYRYNDELAAVSDHESFVGKRTPPGEWAEVARTVDEHYEPGGFVTLHAFEWTGRVHPGPGHKVVLLPQGDSFILSRDDPRCSSSAGLIAQARKLGALVFPHHVGWTGADMDSHDPAVQTCWEIVSCHGAYERPGTTAIPTRGEDKAGQFAAEALDKGLRFGFVGGSDGHGLNYHHGVCRWKDSHRSGLTGVLSKDFSREGVFAALRRRRCYATSGAKIGLWFEIDGRPMGEELVTGGPLPFRVVIVGTAKIQSLSLVSNGGAEIELQTGGHEAEVHGVVPPPPKVGWCYYYVRVVQDDGHVAWSSPIWLDALESA
jgi:hypothetical protein